jgi:hypothetical protein
MPRDAPVMTTTFRSGVMFALSHGRGCVRASRCTNGPNAASRQLLNCCHFLLPVRRRSCQRCTGTEQASDPSPRERTGEVGLARKLEGQRNMGQRLVSLLEQLFGELKPLRADIVMRKRGHASVCVDQVLPELHGRRHRAPACRRGFGPALRIFWRRGEPALSAPRDRADFCQEFS